MHQPFLNQASAQLNYMTTDELREIFSDDDKLDDRINEIVRRKKCSLLLFKLHYKYIKNSFAA